MEQAKSVAVAPGTWGGVGAGVIIEKKAVKFQYDCADGEIREPLKTDEKGNFKLAGFYKRLPFGPLRLKNLPKFVPVVYHGNIKGKVMKYTITLTETDEVIGTYTVERGKTARIRRCA